MINVWKNWYLLIIIPAILIVMVVFVDVKEECLRKNSNWECEYKIRFTQYTGKRYICRDYCWTPEFEKKIKCKKQCGIYEYTPPKNWQNFYPSSKESNLLNRKY